MSEPIVRWRLGVLFLLLVGGALVWILLLSPSTQPTTLLQVHFLDVGQGDAIFIETPDGLQVLVDGGRDGTVLRALSNEMSWLDRSIDVLVSTHPDEDHIGGLVDVLKRYQVATIMLTENTGESLTASTYQGRVAAETDQLIYARAGQVLRLGASTTMTVLSPASNPARLESNTSSIVMQLRFGDIEFMLTGDAPQGIEAYLVSRYGAELESEVLKLGHHGSKTSSAAEFLAAVSPQYAVVSAGIDNRYGHPNPDVIKRTKAVGARILSTQDQGTITLLSDGQAVWLE